MNNKRKTVILIKGKARVGKDTFAVMLNTQFRLLSSFESEIFPNAKAVKELARDFYNWNGEKDTRGRKLLIDITNTGYAYSKYFWEEKNKLNDYTGDICIVPDFRWINTYKYFKENKDKYNVITIKLLGDRRESVSKSIDTDPSEGEMDLDFDYEVINEGSFKELQDMSSHIAISIIGGM